MCTCNVLSVIGTLVIILGRTGAHVMFHGHFMPKGQMVRLMFSSTVMVLVKY